ncbi:MAG: hypothetical protein WC520_02635 [Candidatus Paceibacterota bacterium]
MENFKPEHQEPINESADESIENEESENIKELFRGIWADKLNSGQELPVGGNSIFSDELNVKLKLDFENFDESLTGFTKENIGEVYNRIENDFKDYVKKIDTNIDPYLYFLCCNIQKKVHDLLEIDSNTPQSSFERLKMHSDTPPKLSELKGKTECAERSALGQYIFQKSGVESAYVSGISMEDANDMDAYPEPHSFIVIKDIKGSEKTLIFDVANPHAGNIPRVFETDVPFTYQLLKDEKDLLVGTTESLAKKENRKYFGVGEPICTQHKVIEENV